MSGPHAHPLVAGTRLHDFEILGLHGEGGFSLVYLALDHSLQRRVALKEYMPAAFATRGQDQSVVVLSQNHRGTFTAGLRSFVDEARLLAQFDHPALVKVYRFWEGMGTAYMAMPLYEGVTLRQYLKTSAVSEDVLKELFGPILDALELLHGRQCIHRDVAPDNIMIQDSGMPVLLDLGAARRVIGDMTQAFTAVLKPGYAPIEQYADDASMKQGPWTDVYAVAAVLYLAVAGKPPPPSIARVLQDKIRPLQELATGYSSDFLNAIARGLAVRPNERPQSIAEFRSLLGIPIAEATGPRARAAASDRAAQRTYRDAETEQPSAEPISSTKPDTSDVTRSAVGPPTAPETVPPVLVSAATPVTRQAPVSEPFTGPSAASAEGALPRTGPYTMLRTRAPVPADLGPLEQQFARFVGPMAKIIVKRAAAEATDLEHLIGILGDQLADDDDRQQFRRSLRGGVGVTSMLADAASTKASVAYVATMVVIALIAVAALVVALRWWT